MQKAYFGWLTALALSACATVPADQSTAAGPTAAGPFAGLADTSWRLVEIQSMDDAQGTTRPDDPQKYTIRFNADGSVSARLDCNRGVGTWRNDIANATGGTLTFGPMGVTKALCPAPTLGETLERHMPYVRSFTMRDGRLNMALMADGGSRSQATADRHRQAPTNPKSSKA
ncbi:META domain-containing protein [Croceicoccus ponticola]|uniref:META domain-containing protein n=1 Tax=Croceicoccus ponticola TaxID=2217664 RepID=UPI0013E2BECF|nr:META domain-containing protein [Croceicoccus ponticola]